MRKLVVCSCFFTPCILLPVFASYPRHRRRVSFWALTSYAVVTALRWGAAAFRSCKAISPLCCLALSSPAMDVCIPRWGLAGSDEARQGRHQMSAGKDTWRTRAWQRTLLAVPWQHRWVSLSLATLFNLVLEQRRQVLRLSWSQLGCNQQHRGSWRNQLLTPFISGH